MTWEELEQIAEDFEHKRDEHQNTVKQYAEVLQKCLGVHSLSYRVKDTKHLIEKMIRKNSKYLELGNALSLSNYEQEIYYHLKYRNTNPQTLELFLIGLENGKKIYTAS